MGITGNDLTLFFISVLGHHRDNLEHNMYTKQALKTGRLAEDMRENNWVCHVGLLEIERMIEIIGASRNNKGNN